MSVYSFTFVGKSLCIFNGHLIIVVQINMQLNYLHTKANTAKKFRTGVCMLMHL